MRQSTHDEPIVDAGFKINNGELVGRIQGQQIDGTVWGARNEGVNHAQFFFESTPTIFQDVDQLILCNRRILLQKYRPDGMRPLRSL